VIDMTAIAIDGPAGAGKSTVARSVAKELGFIYVDTGALYRTIGLFAARGGIDVTDEAALGPRLSEVAVELRYQAGEQRILLNGEDVSEAIRSPEISLAASQVSALGSVRAFLLQLQRDMAERCNVIMDGRDIGTVVLPDAQIKIYLTASPEARARRRCDEYLAKGEKVQYNKVLEDMRQRDHDDSHREIAPLRQAEDAVLLDTSDCATVQQSIALVRDFLRKRGIG